MSFFSAIGNFFKKVWNGITSTARTIGVSLGLIKKPPAQVSINQFGKLEHNIDLSNLNSDEKKTFETQLRSAVMRRDDISKARDIASQNGDTDAVKMLDVQLSQIQKGLTEAKFQVESANGIFSIIGVTAIFGPIGLITAASTNGSTTKASLTLSTITASPQSLQEAQLLRQQPLAPPVCNPVPESSDACPQHSTSYSHYTPNKNLSTADRIVNLMGNNPQEAIKLLNSIENPEDRAMMMQAVRARLQAINQLVTMMSTLSKSIHDTHRTIISNMRV